MKITVSELKRIIKEELNVMEADKKRSPEDEKRKNAVNKLLQMIESQKAALQFKPQDEEAFSNMIGDLLQALATKYKVSPQKLSKFATHTAKDMKAAMSDNSGSKPGTQTLPTK